MGEILQKFEKGDMKPFHNNYYPLLLKPWSSQPRYNPEKKDSASVIQHVSDLASMPGVLGPPVCLGAVEREQVRS